MNSGSNLVKLFTGSIVWLVILWAMWIGYQIGKEAKTNWFNTKSTQDSTIIDNKVLDNHHQLKQ